ncbi:MAG TPA: hypothetical protein V6D14_00495 [Coleofasciculaceae cyanobacterium]
MPLSCSDSSIVYQIIGDRDRFPVVAQFSPNRGKVAVMEVYNLFNISDNFYLVLASVLLITLVWVDSLECFAGRDVLWRQDAGNVRRCCLCR